jgi:hypothetical protein
MGSLFKTPKPPRAAAPRVLNSPIVNPAVDPTVLAFQKAGQQRAEGDRIKALQDQLALETRYRNRRFGLRSLLGPFGRPALKSLLGSG